MTAKRARKPRGLEWWSLRLGRTVIASLGTPVLPTRYTHPGYTPSPTQLAATRYTVLPGTVAKCRGAPETIPGQSKSSIQRLKDYDRGI